MEVYLTRDPSVCPFSGSFRDIVEIFQTAYPLSEVKFFYDDTIPQDIVGTPAIMDKSSGSVFYGRDAIKFLSSKQRQTSPAMAGNRHAPPSPSVANGVIPGDLEPESNLPPRFEHPPIVTQKTQVSLPSSTERLSTEELSRLSESSLARRRRLTEQ